jgi:CHAT domain-containing protein
LADAAVLHFATHGLVDDQHPERSALALTPAAGSDGLLQVREIYGLRLNAVLVTLSACKTAAGKEVTGEGVMGLSRAFLYAGAGAVMASLWNVNDASTTVFMGRFYRSLEKRRTIAEAAREAKLALRRDRRWSHPYYWAPFVVTGNAAVAVPLTSERSWPWWPVAVAAACGSAGTFAFARRRRVTRRTVSVE